MMFEWVKKSEELTGNPHKILSLSSEKIRLEAQKVRKKIGIENIFDNKGNLKGKLEENRIHDLEYPLGEIAKELHKVRKIFSEFWNETLLKVIESKYLIDLNRIYYYAGLIFSSNFFPIFLESDIISNLNHPNDSDIEIENIILKKTVFETDSFKIYFVIDFTEENRFFLVFTSIFTKQDSFENVKKEFEKELMENKDFKNLIVFIQYLKASVFEFNQFEVLITYLLTENYKIKLGQMTPQIKTGDNLFSYQMDFPIEQFNFLSISYSEIKLENGRSIEGVLTPLDFYNYIQILRVFGAFLYYQNYIKTDQLVDDILLIMTQEKRKQTDSQIPPFFYYDKIIETIVHKLDLEISKTVQKESETKLTYFKALYGIFLRSENVRNFLSKGSKVENPNQNGSEYGWDYLQQFYNHFVYTSSNQGFNQNLELN